MRATRAGHGWRSSEESPGRLRLLASTPNGRIGSRREYHPGDPRGLSPATERLDEFTEFAGQATDRLERNSSPLIDATEDPAGPGMPPGPAGDDRPSSPLPPPMCGMTGRSFEAAGAEPCMSSPATTSICIASARRLVPPNRRSPQGCTFAPPYHRPLRRPSDSPFPSSLGCRALGFGREWSSLYFLPLGELEAAGS
jgi:hypothetical protein